MTHRELCNLVSAKGEVRATLAVPRGDLQRGHSGILYVGPVTKQLFFAPDMPTDGYLVSVADLHIPELDLFQS